ncbi:MAG: hypothetical protein AAFR66_25115, partial [Bacteroidota bacterium]
MNRLTRLFLFSITVMIGWACADSTASEDAQATSTNRGISEMAALPSFRTQKVVLQSTDQLVNITGRTQSLESIQITSEVQGKVLNTGKILNEGVSYRRGET